MPNSKGKSPRRSRKPSQNELTTEQELRAEIRRLKCVVTARPSDFGAPSAPDKPRLSRHQRQVIQKKRLSSFASLAITLLCLLAVVTFIIYQAKVQL